MTFFAILAEEFFRVLPPEMHPEARRISPLSTQQNHRAGCIQLSLVNPVGGSRACQRYQNSVENCGRISLPVIRKQLKHRVNLTVPIAAESWANNVANGCRGSLKERPSLNRFA